MAAKESLTKGQNKEQILFGSSNEPPKPIVLLLTHELLIHDLSTSGVKEFFGKEPEPLINASFIDLLIEQQMNTDELVCIFKSNSNGLLHNIVLEHPSFGKKYIITIITLRENTKTPYILTVNVLDESYTALKAYMNAIINNLPGAVYWKDKEGRYMGCNKFVATMAGFQSPDEMIGKTDYDLCWSEFAEEWRLLDNQVIQENATIQSEENVKLASGKIITELTFKTPLKNQQDETIGVIGTSLDITDRKLLEAALKESKNLADAANQAKTEFLANMRHDIRTPLSGIVGFSEILKTESSEPHIKEYADNLVASSHALLELMDEVLEAVRVSSGEIPLLKRKFNLNDTIKQVINLYASRAQEKKLALSLTLDPKLPNYVIGDKIRLHRIALELVGNALNFTNRGSVTVHLALAKQDHHQLVLKMTVTDTGISISKDKQQEIYLQFKRLTPSYQGIYKGTGLGLYVVKQFIDELGGEIYVESEAGKGSVFTCLIPLKIPLLDDSSGVDTSDDLKTDRPFISSLKNKMIMPKPVSPSKTQTSVLIVEDNVIAQSVVKALLSALSCEVSIASSGHEALTLCKQHHYDLIFMDIGLGEGMDGYEVTRYIRTHLDTTNSIPIIALTAHGGGESKQRCIEAGMDAVLTKPLTQTNAADILNSFIPERYDLSSVKLNQNWHDLPDNDEELFQLSQFALFDNEEALKNCGSHTMLIKMLTLTLQQLPTDLEHMKRAFAAKDYSLVEKMAYKMKGSAIYLNMLRMKYACQYLERYWKSEKHDLFVALYYQTIATIKETLLYIQNWLARCNNSLETLG